MIKTTEPPVDEQSLRKTLHEKIEQMKPADLNLLNQIVSQVELERISGELDDAFDRARAAGELTDEKIQEAIARHRARHPYPK